MEANAIAEILEFGSWALAQDSPARETVPDAPSDVNRERNDQIAAPRSKAHQEPNHRDDDRGRGPDNQILAAAEAMSD